jgi:hypothetical protein
MVGLLPAILDALDRRKHRLLLVAQTALPKPQFEAFRKIVLDELGTSGFQRELEDALKRHRGKERIGTPRATRIGALCVEQVFSVSIIWGDGAGEAPSVEEIELLLADLEALLQEMQEMQGAEETDDA